jgi:hypothetical protein
VVTDDPDEVMPPPSSKRTLTDRQKALLKRWIEQGAAWEDHWSYQPVRRPAVPTVNDPKWVRNPVDAFVLARLEREGLKPAAEADKVTLIRRVTLDLTGLPPTPAEVDAFVADPSPDAYERVVDRLLSSVRYGERMALEWLDAARYADTHGYHIDSGRDMTRWREWVIDAFHQNKPYDRFTVEQLAGDLLPDGPTPEATLAQKVASGFNRNHMVNFEGGAIAEEYRTAYVLDRVNTTGTVWLGLTVACTQCHDHKYDPITQKEYFQLYAFFNSIGEKGLDGNFGNAAPYLATPNRAQRKALDELTAKAAELEKRLTGPLADADAAAGRVGGVAVGRRQGEGGVGRPRRRQAGIAGRGDAEAAGGQVGAGGREEPGDGHVHRRAADPAGPDAGDRRPLEALPDKSLPPAAPGRSENGNVVMTEFKVGVARGEPSGRRTPLKVGPRVGQLQPDGLRRGRRDRRQAGHRVGHLPRSRQAERGGVRPGRAGDGRSGRAAERADARLVVTLEFKSQFAQHQLGRFRLSLTDAASPSQAARCRPA